MLYGLATLSWMHLHGVIFWNEELKYCFCMYFLTNSPTFLGQVNQ